MRNDIVKREIRDYDLKGQSCNAPEEFRSVTIFKTAINKSISSYIAKPEQHMPQNAFSCALIFL